MPYTVTPEDKIALMNIIERYCNRNEVNHARCSLIPQFGKDSKFTISELRTLLQEVGIDHFLNEESIAIITNEGFEGWYEALYQDSEFEEEWAEYCGEEGWDKFDL